MKSVKLFAVAAMLLMSSIVVAQCPTQKTTIFFINGVDTERQDAVVAKDYIKRILSPFPFFNSECVSVKLAYSRTEGLTTDILEAARQKEIEEDLTPTNFWEMFTRAFPVRPWFVDLMAEVYLKGPPDFRDRKIFAQINEHLNTLYRAEPEDTNLMLFGHSQGTLFGNEAWLAMTPSERVRTKLLAVATPAFAIADGGPYTTIEEDKLITNTFVGELEPNVPAPNRLDDELCPDDWWCHGIETSYLFPATASRIRILADVKRLLPEEPPPPAGIFYQTFAEGDPGVPGDGKTISPQGGLSEALFELQPTFPIQGVRNGITISIFEIIATQQRDLTLSVNFIPEGHSPAECLIGFGTETMVLPPVNGIQGVAHVVDQAQLSNLVDTVRTHPACADVTLDDFRLHSVALFDSEGRFVETLDALAVGIGENAFPR